MKYNFDKVVNRKGSHSYKWDVLDNELPMWVADMDFSVLKDIKDAIKVRLDIDAYGYSSCPKEYFEAYKMWWKKRHNIELDVNKMAFSIGVLASLDTILKHLVKSNSNVVMLSPIYHAFYHCIENNGLKVVTSKLTYKNYEYEIDFDNLEKLFKDKDNKTFILCNPHNPIGRIWTKDELVKVSKLCKKYGVLLISDEIHCDIVEPGYEYVPILKVYEDAITLIAPTKVFNLAGIQTSLVTSGNKELVDKIRDYLYKDDNGEPNYVAPYATIAAFTKGEEWVNELNEYITSNKNYMKEFIEKELPMIKFIDIHATYLGWIDISKLTKDSDTFASNLRKQTGLYLSSGNQFGPGGEGFLRINLATSKENVIDACNRLCTFIKKNY